MAKTVAMPKHVSVVIPTYNRAYCLTRALDSVLNQTSPLSEIIIVDDGSDDGTHKLLENYGFSGSLSESQKLRYVRQNNKGVSAARNLGIRYARGEYIAFLDSDDAWGERKIERQLAVLSEKRWTKRIVHTDEEWIRNGRKVNPRKKHLKSGGDIFAKCLPLCCISPSSVLIHRSLFEDYGLFDETLPACEDYDMWLRITAFEEVLFVQEALTVKYGGHDDQLSRAYWGMDRFRVKSLEKLVNNERITHVQRSQAIEMLIRKLSILAVGARKRGKISNARDYETKKKFWEDAGYSRGKR